MSKIVDKLRRVAQATAQPIGFRTATTAAPSPSMLLLVLLPPGGVPSAAPSLPNVDGWVVSSQMEVELSSLSRQLAQVAGDIPWGVWLSPASQEDMRRFQEAGCDFFILERAAAPAAALHYPEGGKLLRVEAAWDDSTLKAVGQLGVDAVLFSGAEAEPFLTLQHLIECHRLTSLIRKPLLAMTPVSLTAEDLKSLWEAGVDGIVVEHKEGEPWEKLKEWREWIAKLPPPGKRRRREVEALLPRVETPPSSEEGEDKLAKQVA